MNTVKETVEWRLYSFAITFIITYIWTGELLEAGGLAIALNVSKTIAYYLWRKFKKGHIRKHLREMSPAMFRKPPFKL